MRTDTRAFGGDFCAAEDFFFTVAGLYFECILVHDQSGYYLRLAVHTDPRDYHDYTVVWEEPLSRDYPAVLGRQNELYGRLDQWLDELGIDELVMERLL